MAKKRRSRKNKLNKSVVNTSNFDKYINLEDIDVYKPSDGVNKIRILPGMGEEADSFGHVVFFHYKVGPDSSTYVCPLKSGKHSWCPICTERGRLQNSATDDYLYSLKPKSRMLSYVIDRKAGDDEVKFWAMPMGSVNKPGLARQIIDYAEDEDTGELLSFDDYYEGFDLSFKVNNAGKPTAEYHTVKFSQEASPILDDDEELEALMDWLDENLLDSIVEVYSPDYIAQKFMAEVPEEQESEEEEEETPRRRRGKKKTGWKKPVEEEPEQEETDDEPPFDTEEEEAEGEEEEPEQEEEEEDEKSVGRARLNRFKKKAKKKRGKKS